MKSRKQQQRTARTVPTVCPKCGTSTATAPITDRGWVSGSPPVYEVIATCSCGAKLNHFVALGIATPAQVSAFEWKVRTWEHKIVFSQPVIGAILAGVVERRSAKLDITVRNKRNGVRVNPCSVQAVGKGRTVGVWKSSDTPLCVDVWFAQVAFPLPTPAVEFEYDLPLPDDVGELAVLAHLFSSATEAELLTEFRGLVAHPSKPVALR